MCIKFIQKINSFIPHRTEIKLLFFNDCNFNAASRICSVARLLANSLPKYDYLRIKQAARKDPLANLINFIYLSQPRLYCGIPSNLTFNCFAARNGQ